MLSNFQDSRFLRSKWINLTLLVTVILSSACVTPLSVRRHETATLTNGDANAIFKNFSDVVNTADSTDDFACTEDFNFDNVLPAIYTRSGNVGTYNGPSNLNSSATYNAVLATPGYVKVVNNITWCSGFGANIIGCAPIGGTSMTVTRVGASEGILWAHEYGHTVGLRHRTDNNAIMNGMLASWHDEVTAGECYAFVSRATNNPFNNTGIDTGAGGAATAGRAASLQANSLQVASPVDIQLLPGADVTNFVRQTYIHGTPVDLAQQFEGQENAGLLVGMLGDSRESEHWGNIVFTLGVIGGTEDVPHIIDWLERESSEEMDWTTVRQVSAGMMGLGYLSNRTGSPEALEYLLEAAQPLNAIQTWIEPEMADVISDGAAIGLAMVGTRESLRLLEHIELVRSFGRVTHAVPLEELMDLNLEVQEFGIQRHFLR